MTDIQSAVHINSAAQLDSSKKVCISTSESLNFKLESKWQVNRHQTAVANISSDIYLIFIHDNHSRYDVGPVLTLLQHGYCHVKALGTVQVRRSTVFSDSRLNHQSCTVSRPLADTARARLSSCPLEIPGPGWPRMRRPAWHCRVFYVAAGCHNVEQDL